MNATRICSALLVAAALFAPMAAHAQRVLFVGNSLTGYNDLPAVFQHLAVAGGHDAYVEEYVWYGHTLKAQEARPDLQAALTTRKWDYVVLQEYSTEPLTKPDEFKQSLLDYDKLAKAAGAKTVLLENWALKGKTTYSDIVAAYEDANKPVGAQLVPLAKAWDTVNANGGIELYRDTKHPTPIATYMAACTIFATLYRQSPKTLPHEGITVVPHYSEGKYGGVPQMRTFVNLDTIATAANVAYVQGVAADCAGVK